MSCAEKNLKRDRSANFTGQECTHLVDLAIKYAKVIENKKTDSVTWKDKDKIWKKIEDEFNALLINGHRSSKVLRSKYECIKKNIKKKKSSNKCEIYKTGGGPAKILNFTDYEEKLLSILAENIEGIIGNVNDSDSVPLETETLISIQKRNESNINVVNEFDLEFPEVQVPKRPHNQVNDEVIIIAGVEDNIGEAQGEEVWNSMKPKQLKKKKTPELNVQNKQQKKNINDEFSEIARNRNELVELQKQIALKELEIKEKELYFWTLKINYQEQLIEKLKQDSQPE